MAEIKSISDLIKEVSPYYKKKGAPESEHKLVYDSSSEQLEPIYFFILDLMNDFGLAPEKLVDNFSSSVGSGHFGEYGQRASVMQQSGTKILADMNAVLRSVLNLIYDLREFKIRLQAYDDLKDSTKNNAATLSLKQLWMDKVDMQKGNSSLKAMGLGQAGFATLIDAFLAAKDFKDAEKLDLNDRVKRIVIQRLQEFNVWVSESDKELRKRFEIEKTYLKSQVNSLKIYSRWAKPYLKAAYQLEMKDQPLNPALVKAFNTIILEMTLLGKRELDVKGNAAEGEFPREFRQDNFLRRFKRKYYNCILVDFNFRGIPQQVQGKGGYTFGGRTEVTFKAYSLNEEEIEKLKKELETSDLDAALGLINGITDDSLGQLKTDIEYFLGEDQKEEKKFKDTSNPFLALFGVYEKKSEQKKEIPKKDEIKDVKSDDWYEKTFFRAKSASDSTETLFSLFDIYKKAHGMASFA